MNDIANFLADKLGVVFSQTLSCNFYEADSNSISINIFNDSFIGFLVKIACKRPTKKNWTQYHELGHAFANVMSINNQKESNKLFGDFDEHYPDDLLLQAWMMYDYEGEYLTAYAATHPEEDFAECFAYVLHMWDKDNWGVEDDVLIDKLEFIRKGINKLID